VEATDQANRQYAVDQSRVIVTTGRYLGEGFDFSCSSMLVVMKSNATHFQKSITA
jgi:hypothetical protein